ncbi:MAG: ATP-binding protein [Peptococcaceae bacterium]|nr:ATP-binding protein [Peptococcaceae bacterium]
MVLVKRKMTEKLAQWMGKGDKRMPLIVHGARQVGKTYTVREFGLQHYRDMIYVNFETNVRLAAIFEENISPQHIINHLEMFFGQRITPGETLIFFDEVQVCERALTSLKYFCEDAPHYHVIAAGSLLGVAVNRTKYSFPVGKVDMLVQYPLDFEEFLWACGQEILAGQIRRCYHSDTPLSEALHNLALEYYRFYMVVGGMPAAVNGYWAEKRLIDATAVHALILNAYVADMSKYASASEATKIMACFNSIPAQLSKDNRKFQYKVVQKGGSATLFGASLDWLSAAGVIAKCNKIEHGYMPPAVYQSLSSFKVYMSDVGLLTTKSGLVAHDILSGFKNSYVGALTENYVANALSVNGFSLYYWESDSIAKVDFVVQDYDKVVPIEVKADIHVKSRSLSVYMSKYDPPYALRISAKNFGFVSKVKSVPLYAVFCIGEGVN